MKEVVSVASHCHRLKAENLQDTYICDGCKERGTEWRYRCHACNYDMHNFCAVPPPSIPHPLSDAKMELRSSPVAKDSLWCSACERSVSGLRYSCRASGDVLHPCCAHLPKTQTMDNSYKLRFSKSLSADPCNWCGQRTRGWAYVSREYSIHVHCLRKALEKAEAPALNLSTNRSSPQLSSGRLQLTAAPSNSSIRQSRAGMTAAPSNSSIRQSQAGLTASLRQSQAGLTTSGTLQVYEPNKSNHGLKAFCQKTKLFLRAIRSILFGDPSSVIRIYVTSIASRR